MNESLPHYNVVPFRHKNKPLGINHQMAVAKNSISFLPGPSKRKSIPWDVLGCMICFSQ